MLEDPRHSRVLDRRRQWAKAAKLHKWTFNQPIDTNRYRNIHVRRLGRQSIILFNESPHPHGEHNNLHIISPTTPSTSDLVVTQWKIRGVCNAPERSTDNGLRAIWEEKNSLQSIRCEPITENDKGDCKGVWSIDSLIVSTFFDVELLILAVRVEGWLELPPVPQKVT